MGGPELRPSGDRAMNQIIETIQDRHQKILRAVNALSRAVVADAEGVYSLQLSGFLRHKLLPHMHREEHHLCDLVDGITEQNPGVAATMVIDHQLVESQIDSIGERLRTAALENAQDSERRGVHRELETLLAQLNAVFGLHLRREEQVYLMAFNHYARRGIGSEIRLRMQREHGDGKTDNLSTDAAAGGIS